MPAVPLPMAQHRRCDQLQVKPQRHRGCGGHLQTSQEQHGTHNAARQHGAPQPPAISRINTPRHLPDLAQTRYRQNANGRPKIEQAGKLEWREVNQQSLAGRCGTPNSAADRNARRIGCKAMVVSYGSIHAYARFFGLVDLLDATL